MAQQLRIETSGVLKVYLGCSESCCSTLSCNFGSVFSWILNMGRLIGYQSSIASKKNQSRFPLVVIAVFLVAPWSIMDKQMGMTIK